MVIVLFEMPINILCYVRHPLDTLAKIGQAFPYICTLCENKHISIYVENIASLHLSKCDSF
jgi:hypothetical protein